MNKLKEEKKLRNLENLYSCYRLNRKITMKKEKV